MMSYALALAATRRAGLSCTGWWPNAFNGRASPLYLTIPADATGAHKVGNFMKADGYSGWFDGTIRSITTNDDSANDRSWKNNVIVRADFGYWAIYLRSNTGEGQDGIPRVGITHFDKAAYYSAEMPIEYNTALRIMWRYRKGIGISIAVNGVWSDDVACNDLDPDGLNQSIFCWLKYGADADGPLGHTDGELHELALRNRGLDDISSLQVDAELLQVYGALIPAPVNPSPYLSCLPANAHTYESVQITADAAYLARDGASLRFFKGKWWLFGGWNPAYWPSDSTNEVWSSVDRNTWTLELTHDPDPPVSGPGARWKPRHTFATEVWKGYVWIFGGDLAGGSGTTKGIPWNPTDVWRSADSIIWERMCAITPWYDNALYIGGLYNNALHVICGVRGLGRTDRLEHWRSTDGVTWQRLPDPPFRRFAVMRMVNLCGKMLMMGGASGTLTAVPPEMHNSTWAYDDSTGVGIWACQSESAPWLGRYWIGVCAYDSKLWVLTGRNYDTGELGDVWYSNDLGITWLAYAGEQLWFNSHADGIDATEETGITIATGYAQQKTVCCIRKVV